MASEIRANKQTNRVGLGTVTYTDTGIIVSGIVTANSFKTDGNSFNVTGNSIFVGVTTFSDDVTFATASGNNIVFDKSDNQLEFGNDVKAEFGASGQLEVNFESYSGNSVIRHTSNLGSLVLHSDNLDLRPRSNGGHVYLRANYNDGVDLYFANSKKFETTVKGIQVGTGVTIETNGQATYTGIVTATSFSGDGSSLSNLPAGAPVGGASTNTVFFENDTAVAVNYQITSGKNAMSAGPIAINAGIAVTVPSGSSWTIV